MHFCRAIQGSQFRFYLVNKDVINVIKKDKST
jgi:hypothetical protein